MKKTGVTRKLDELGRIVIPKEIRKNMHLKTGEMLEIFINNSEELVLKRQLHENSDYKFIEMFLKSVSEKLKCSIYVTNLNNIIISTNEKYIGELINCEISDIININKSNVSTNLFYLSKNCVLRKPYDIYLLSLNGDLFGIIIYELNESLDEDGKGFIKFVNSFIESYLNEYI